MKKLLTNVIAFTLLCNSTSIIAQSIFPTNGNNVGIGTTSPNTLLHIEKSSGALLRLSNDLNNFLYSGIDGYGAYFEQVANTPGKSKIRLQTRNSNQGTYSQFLIDGGNGNFSFLNGNVGVGTISPNDILHVSKTAAATRFRVGNNGAYDASIYFNGNSDWSIGMDYSNSNAFTISNYSTLGTNTKFIIEPGGNVGIGTTNPFSKMHIKIETESTSWKDQVVIESNISTGYGIAFAGNGHHRGGIFMKNIGGTTTATGELNLWARDNGNIILDGGNVGIGTTIPDSKLSVNGKIHAKEVKVDLTGWPDYVFASTYKLPTLKEVEKHINQKGHLPNIPNAKEVSKNGILLGEMNKKLLQKIEELTLYAIQQEKRIAMSNKNDEKLLLIIQKLERRIQKLEK